MPAWSTVAFRAVPMFTIAWHVHITVPAFLHKIHRLAASAVLRAIPAPVTLMRYRHIQIHRFTHNTNGWAVNNGRTGIYDLRAGNSADINPAIQARLRKIEGDADVSGETGSAGSGKGCCQGCCK
ncbi:hypothetical protein GCM10011396_25630 [Undibacterium terreum]|uniref:Uncharacterized protein n=1 Tax=Undibacterium terreum TaxID=1224302 RepID=A0A916XJU4_9BURK|nr:hypothetical protein GCM10011396_25630 [Undibacterium terreum]